LSAASQEPENASILFESDSEVDPAMRAPTPKGVDPSVIPPAGTPGGDQNVQPK
jgi:hypothetical protein